MGKVKSKEARLLLYHVRQLDKLLKRMPKDKANALLERKIELLLAYINELSERGVN